MGVRLSLAASNTFEYVVMELGFRFEINVFIFIIEGGFVNFVLTKDLFENFKYYLKNLFLLFY